MDSPTPTGRVFGRSVPIASSSSTASPRRSNNGSPSRVQSPSDSLQSMESISSSTSDEGTTAMNCPICNESMVTLLQLNRHLDDVHSEVAKVENDEIKNWFRKKVEKAKQLQTMTSVFQNGPFSRFDLFDQEEPTSQETTPTKRPSTPVVEDVTKKHWQKPSMMDRCSDVLCDKPLNARNGCINCRQCGKLFCNMHTKYQIKLSKTARHNPDGAWCRVCETCFKSRTGYNDHSGTSTGKFDEFAKLRQQHIDARELEVNRLEKRLVKLLDMLRPFCDDSGLLNYARIQQRRKAERSVAKWEEDSAVSECRICTQRFGYTLRKHHCRICGLVVCADVNTECSKNVQLSILSEKLEKGVAKVPSTSDLAIRICSTCKDTVFARKNFDLEMNSAKPSVLRVYDTMTRLRKSIELATPKFQVMLQHINDPNNPPPHDTLTEASTIRKRLLENFFQYESLTRKLLTMEAANSTEKRLQKQIYQVGAQFLQDNLLPLKAVPKVLKHAANHQPPPKSQLSQQIPSEEHQELQQQLEVMQEQKQMISGMAEDAKARRKYDELAPLEQNMTELQLEIDSIQAKLG